MKILPALAFPLVLAVSSCGTSYQPLGISGGYSETRLAPDVVKVRFSANAYTSSEKAQDLALLRCADLCLQSGYRYFHVGADSVNVSHSTIVTPGSSFTTGTATGYGYGVGYNQTTTYMPPQVTTLNKPQAEILVKFLKAKPSGIEVFDAVFISSSIRQKYGIK